MGGTPSWRVGIDVGGTFTDLCLVDATGRRIILAKVLTTPRDLARGVISGLERALAAGGVPASMVTHIIHGTTVATNAIIERKGARTALITTRGFRDVLEIGREFRYDTDDPYIVFPEPLVPRWLRREVTERVTASGEVLAEPDSGEIAALARELLDVGVESVAIAFLHAYADHRHERAAAVRFAEIAPAVSVSTSAEVARQEREFERTSTCVLNAYVKPLVNRYLGRLESGLSNVGAGGRLMIKMSSGGMADVSTERAVAVRLV
ncbi:MAG: hydantoinase/oxoprolinase family protein, partial [Armatimonadetes bacterium]|nr:hydantoinase/oxoprolinase family protein [Armatimonadota bacterium]